MAFVLDGVVGCGIGASMPSGFLIDSRVLITVFEVPGRKGIDDIDAYTTAYQAVGGTGHEPRADRA